MITTVLQGRGDRSAAAVVSDVRLAGRVGIRAAEARRAGRCSVCELPADPESLDASGRCWSCQP